jgi:phosphonate degradation associated HDIG domain protein
MNSKETAMDDRREVAAGEVVDYLIGLLRDRGDGAYFGEPVSQTEHALQAAWSAEQHGAAAPLVAAALLHDVGHLLHDLSEHCADDGIDGRHEELGAQWLRRYFPPEVTEPIHLHVAAKRYLCVSEPGYLDRLSEASLESLALQGGPFKPDEARAFAAGPHARAALELRRWDEAAKIPGLKTPDLEHFRPFVEAARLPG